MELSGFLKWVRSLSQQTCKRQNVDIRQYLGNKDNKAASDKKAVQKWRLT